MKLQDAINLIKAAEISPKQTAWADLGCGSGTFTYALANLLAPQSNVIAVDKSRQQLSTIVNDVTIKFQQADFVIDILGFKELDGILMANALHYVKNKLQFIQQLKNYLNKKGMFIIIEYDTMQANRWVPYPLNMQALKDLFSEAGFSVVKKLGALPSVYHNNNLYACEIS